MSSEVQTVHPGLAASVHAPTAGSGSGGKRPDRRDGDRRPPDRGPGKVTKKKKGKKWCLGCKKWGHTLDKCRVYGNVLSNLALSTTRTIAAARSGGRNRVLATGGSRPQVGGRHPLGPRQERPRMNGLNSRERREAQRLAAGLWRPQQPQQQTQEQQQT
ncbi:uncharacterized protein P174DRAFT_434517 [Aspergillus novofumigatus IBT 16806]|uniref:Uncharacterized protein n=1 Tax=Aspergillus novofumigatus (strain IBT 16806) TaxID=1392255 RepID=A0A2I1BXM1_ASPN1|nr:uncharacterized protein P174DRAFT_434517 [Aspergillus novofumigatus IBT 16806]PKX90099.1 hypothetical protein P174DRAFT_434517 [Aspergillus novofumigatus IBT 16806]